MHASDAAHSVLRIRRTSADIVSGFWALPIQSRQSAVLKAHCWHAQAQLTSARLCRWQPPQERMCAAAHAWQPDARDARPTTKLAPDRQPLGRVIGRKRSHSRQLTGNTCKPAANGLTACVACNCCCLSPVRSSPTFRLHFAFFGAAFWHCTIRQQQQPRNRHLISYALSASSNHFSSVASKSACSFSSSRFHSFKSV